MLARFWRSITLARQIVYFLKKSELLIAEGHHAVKVWIGRRRQAVRPLVGSSGFEGGAMLAVVSARRHPEQSVAPRAEVALDEGVVEEGGVGAPAL